jgi:hypothetical protein
MIERSRYSGVVADAKRSVWPYARQLQEDEKLRRNLFAALAAGLAAWERITQLTRLSRRTAELVADPVFRREFHDAVRQLEEAQKRIEHARSHRLRNTLLVVAGAGAVATALKSVHIRSWFVSLMRGQADTRDLGPHAQTVSPTSAGEPRGMPEPITPERGL